MSVSPTSGRGRAPRSGTVCRPSCSIRVVIRLATVAALVVPLTASDASALSTGNEPGAPIGQTSVASVRHEHVAQGASSPAKARLQRIVRGLVAAGAPGALAAVRTPTGIRRAASGFASLEPKVRLQPTDRYRVASVTKTFVATLVLELAAEGKLSLVDPVERWLPGMVPDGRSITLRALLDHTSGLFDYDQDQGWVGARFSDPGREWSPQDLVAIATSHPPLFPPGTSWSYSNTNYVLLGLVVEAATGRTLAGELRARLFEPLALGSTSFPSGTAIGGRFAHGYIVSRPPLPTPARTLIDVSSILSPSAWGAGQIVSNADDLTRFFGALLRGRLLRPAQLAAMKTEVVRYGYGLGVRTALTACGRAFGHDGDVPGYRNVVWATANGRRAAAIMVNVDDTLVPWSKLQAAAKTALCSG
jgi:D-alanyl-D-alanine carboxypeptidase